MTALITMALINTGSTNLQTNRENNTIYAKDAKYQSRLPDLSPTPPNRTHDVNETNMRNKMTYMMEKVEGNHDQTSSRYIFDALNIFTTSSPPPGLRPRSCSMISPNVVLTARAILAASPQI